MPLHIKKSLEDIMNVALRRLEATVLENGKKLTSTPGSVSRLLLAVINAELETFYERLEEVHLQSFISTATEKSLELIGDLINCKREGDETDSDYKYRMSRHVTAMQKANELCIITSLLAIEGVQDVKLVKYTHGSGSFTAFIITETTNPSDDIIEECMNVLDENAAYGIKYTVEAPDLVPVEIGIKVIMTNNEDAPIEVLEQCKDRVKQFINSRGIGEELVFNELVETIMSTSESIYDMEVFRYRIDEMPVLNANQSCRPNQRFIESSKPNAILII